MIVSLGRDGLVASLSITRKRTSGTLLYPSRHAPSSLLLGTSGFRSRATLGNRLCLECRGLSTSTQSTTEKPTLESSPKDALPALGLQTRKKVELRPGPVKPQKIQPTEASSTPAQTSTSEKSSEEVKVNPESSSEAGSVIQVTKHDYDEAAQHGILAPPPENASRLYKLYHQAKEFFKFYVRGLKLINTNRIRVRDMKERVKAGGPPLTRWETRFIQTHREDAIKLIPFALIILLLEEVIPLVVLYAPFLLPSTCILPSQKERIDQKKRDKQRAFATMTHYFDEICKRASSDASHTVDSLLDRSGSVSTIGVMGLSTFGPPPIRRHRLKRHLTMIGEDDALLLKEDMGAHLTPSELRHALEERGLGLTDELTVKQQQSRLRWWLSQINNGKHAQDTDPIQTRVVLVARGVTGRF